MRNGAAGTYAQADFSGYKTSTCFEPDGLLQAQVSLQLHHDHRSTLLPGCDTGRSFNGLSKGGFAGLGLMSLPLMALVISPVQAAAIMLPILITQDVVTVWAYRHSWDGRNLAILLPGAMVGIGLGYLLASQVSDAAVALAVGVISIAFAMRRLVAERRGTPAPTKAGVMSGLFWGAVCGFTSMIAHAGGPPFQVYVLRQRLARDASSGLARFCLQPLTGLILVGLKLVWQGARAVL
jgi:uncharacterized membrane protein YfcA